MSKSGASKAGKSYSPPTVYASRETWSEVQVIHSLDVEGCLGQNDMSQFSPPWILPLDFVLQFSVFGIKGIN